MIENSLFNLDHETPKITTYRAIYCLTIPVILFIFGIFFLRDIYNPVQVSLEEKRKLFQWPELTIQSLVNGTYTKNVEAYISDHFPLRGVMIPLASHLKSLRGINLQDYVLEIKGADNGFEDTNSMDARHKKANESNKKDSNGLKMVEGVLIHKDQALFLFGGSAASIRGFANSVNFWKDKFASDPSLKSPIKVSVVYTPTSSYFYLPEKYQSHARAEAKNIEDLRAQLSPDIHFAQVIQEMQGHESEPLFYKTDHHWTGLGAYYAYRAWAISNQIKPVSLSDMDKHIAPGILGSYWNLTRAPEIEAADKFTEYYIPPVKVLSSFEYAGPDQKTPVAWSFFSPKSPGYLIFLGGDLPLMVANTNAGTGKKVLLVKNSYGNAFAPYLLSHFDTVVVIDYRYLTRNIKEIISTFGITDLVFVNVTMIANSGAHQQRLKDLANGSKNAWSLNGKKEDSKKGITGNEESTVVPKESLNDDRNIENLSEKNPDISNNQKNGQ